MDEAQTLGDDSVTEEYQTSDPNLAAFLWSRGHFLSGIHGPDRNSFPRFAKFVFDNSCVRAGIHRRTSPTP